MRQRRLVPPDDADAPDVPLPPHGKPPPAEPLANCRGCRSPTLGTELAKYGNRCASCFEAFCRSGPRGHVPEFDGPLGWARTLVERNRRGENVSRCALQMARDALRGGFRPIDDDGA